MLHQPVLLKEVLENLALRANGIYVDGTFGRGGHAQAILKNLNADGQLLVIDKDPAAIAYAHQVFAGESRVKIEKGSFAEIKGSIEKYAWMGKVDGVLLDLGVSSPQLDEAERGFSFLRDGPLDMRMDSTTGTDAATFLNAAREKEIADVLFQYGEERYARRIARAIVQVRMTQPIRTTGQLATIVADAHPRWERHKHPATRTFQAIRIFINDELKALEQCMEQCLEILTVGGRLLVISFHSLEDRLVKCFMRDFSRGKKLPVGLPITEEALGKRLHCVSRAIRPHDDEIAVNPRARSAILRVAEKII